MAAGINRAMAGEILRSGLSASAVPRDAPEVRAFNPLTDDRWSAFLERHPRASVFHSRPWLEALCRTYGYRAEVYTTSHPDTELRDGIVVCRVASWLTGRRMVSLPFSDHCDILVDDPVDETALLFVLERSVTAQKLRYLELRSPMTLSHSEMLQLTTKQYCYHEIDLKPDADKILSHFHKNSTQRKIRRSQKEGLIYQEGQSDFLLNHFYRIFIQTRRRHGVPPQPRQWFRNLVACFGKSLKIRVAFHGSQSVAGILTLQHKKTLTYKYGGSDASFHSLGGMQLLFWRAICDAKEQKLERFDLGRSSLDEPGLITFKDRLGAARSLLTYYKYSPVETADGSSRNGKFEWNLGAAKGLFSRMPGFMLTVAGRLLYKHIG